MKRFILTAFIFLLVSSATEAQDIAKSGTVYSKIGVGMPTDFGSSSAEGMGLTGVSFIEPFVPGLANPAQWGSTVYGMATGTLGLHNYHAVDNQGSSNAALLSANYFQVQLPISRNKLGLSVAVAPYTRANFHFIQNNEQIIGSGAAADTISYRSDNQGDGGVNMAELGLGWRITQNVSIGYAASLMFASLDNQYTTNFDDPSFATVNFSRQTSGIGFGHRMGVFLNFSNFLRENDQISVGGSLALPVTLEGERVEETTKVFASGNTATTVISDGEGLGKGNIELPMTLNGGITYQPSRIISFSAEGLFQDWSSYENGIDDNNITNPNAVISNNTVNRYKVGAGIRYFPYVTGSDKFLSGFKYRIGASYDMGHMSLKGQRIETLMFSVGLGILSPNQNSNSSVDINFEYGIRGTRDQNLVKENIWGLRLSVNLAELMFFRPKLR